MPPESRDDKDILNQSNNHENTSQTDFPEIEEYFGDDESKKGSILNVLKNGNIGDVFKKILNSKKSENCLFALLECKNDETKIKEVILANLPEGYVYNVSTGSIVENQLDALNNNFSGATTTDKKEEEVVKKEEEAVQKEEEAVKKEEEAVQNVNLIDNMTQRESEGKAMLEALEGRKNLIEKYQNLDTKTNQSSENFQTVKKQLENNGTLNQLRQNHDEQFINDYILVQTTLQELKSNPTDYEQNDISYFDKIVKNLNNACNVPDTNLNSFSSENISQTRTELFHSEVGNDGLIQARDKNLESRDYANIFPEMRDEDLIARYGNFLEGDLKTFCQNYTNNTNGLKNKIEEISKKEEFNLTEEEKKLFDEYKNMLAELGKKREETKDQTKNMMEELCIISQIKGMYMCIGKGADFNLNKANEIRYDKEGAMILDGHIDGIDFSIRQDVSNPEAKLQTSQKLIKNGNAFEVGGKDKFVDSNFILPSQNEIFDSISEIVKTDSSLVDFDNQSDYLENLQSNIMGKMEEKYKDTELVHHYMKEQVKGQKIVNKALGLVERIDSSITDNEELMKNINKDANRKLYTFMKVLKYNIDNSTDIEKDHFDWCIDEIGRVISNYKANKKISGIYSDEISKCLENDIWIHGTQEQGLNLIFDLFNHFNENPISDGRSGLEGDDGIPSNMIINDLYLQLHDKPIAKKEQLKRNEISNADHETADEVLKSWPSEPPVYVA